MSGWQERILTYFQEPIPGLSVVSDPDGLLKDDRTYAALRRRSVEIVEYNEPVAFRYLYESKYRENIEKSRACLVIRTDAEDFTRVSYDLLRAGRRLLFRLADIFPRLSPLAVKELEPRDLEVLYQVYEQYHGTDNYAETCEFILRKVFKAPYDLIDNETELIKFLLAKHYQDKSYPGALKEFLLEKLEKVRALKELPLRDLFESDRCFYSYLQKQWGDFLTVLQKKGKVKEKSSSFGSFPSGGHPFADQNVRRLLDNLFIEGKLKPVQGYNPKLLPEWTHVGMVIDPLQDQKARLQGLTAALKKHLQPEMSYKDWKRLAKVYGEAKHLLLSLELSPKKQPILDWKSLEGEINRRFAEWMLTTYSGLKNLPYLPEPVMVHHIPHYMAAKFRSRVALVVMDGMNYAQWAQIRETLQEKRESFDFCEQSVYAWVPTITSVSRQAIFTGEIPMYFAGSINTTAREEAGWKLFWENHNIMRLYTVYEKGLGHGVYEWLAGVNRDSVKVCGLVIDIVDKLMHNSLQGQKGIYSGLALWLKQGYLRNLLHNLLDAGYDVYLTSDHGNQESKGIGRISEGVLAEAHGERVRVYQDRIMRDQAAQKYSSILWPGDGLPEGYYVLTAKSGESFTRQNEVSVSHGGISLEEVIVPFVRITKSNEER